MRGAILVLASVFFPGTAIAQSDCVTLSRPDAVLKSISRYFLDDDEQPIREGLFAKVDSVAPRLVVSDSRTCQRVMRQLASVLRKTGDWQAFQASGYEFAILQIGTYYAVVIEQPDPPGKTRLARVPMLVFRMSDLGYLGTILV